MEIESFIRFVVVIFAVGLFTIAAYLYLSKSTAAASSAMAFVFLLVVVLTITHYKRIKGFGFEAEMWEDKQLQAAKLIDRLELLSKTSTQQVAQIASKLGLWDSGFSNPELAELIDASRKILHTTGTSDAERQNALAPLNRRIILNYVNAARQLIENEIKREREALDAARKTTMEDELPQWRQQITNVNEAQKKEREIDVHGMIDRKTIEPLQKIVKESPALSAKAPLLAELASIAADISYFETNGTLRRSIDWNYLYK